MRYSRRKDAREARYVAEMVGAIAGRDGKRINGATEERRKRERKKEGAVARIEREIRRMDGSAIVAAREGEKERTRHAAGRTRATDGKTVIGSESEDNYNDRGWVHRERERGRRREGAAA